MISTLLIWFYIFLISTITGHFFFRLCGLLKQDDSGNYPAIYELSMTGLVFTGIFLGIFSLFLKIGLVANIALFSFCLIYFFFSRRSIIEALKAGTGTLLKLSVSMKALLIIYLLLLLLAAQAIPSIADTGLYHIQNIKWISSFKVVPGLGNLQGRFAFNNHSFLTEALFSFSFIKADFFHLLNSYLLLILSVTLIRLLSEYLTVNSWKTLLYSGLLMLLQVFYLKAASSPTPDIFALAGIWFVFIIYIEKISARENRRYWIPMLFTAFLTVTVKLSAFPVALILFLFLTEYRSALWKKIVLVAIPAILVFVPYFIRNYIISGYLIYPFPALDLFNPDWKIPLNYVREMSSIIAAHAQSGGWDQYPFTTWFPHWFSHLSPAFRLVSCYILISPLFMSAIFLLSGDMRKTWSGFFKLCVICVIAIVYWFLNAPNFRFVYAFLLFYLMMNLVIILDFISTKLPVAGKNISDTGNGPRLVTRYVPVILCVLSLIFFTQINYKELDKCLLIPRNSKDVKYSSVELNNFNVNIPEDGTYCWNIPLPASVIQRHIGVNDIEMRGPDLKYGFGMKIDRTEEMLRLRDILRGQ
jgi:hypothetical protein